TLTYTHSSDLKAMQEFFGVSAPGGGFLGDANRLLLYHSLLLFSVPLCHCGSSPPTVPAACYLLSLRGCQQFRPARRPDPRRANYRSMRWGRREATASTHCRQRCRRLSASPSAFTRRTAGWRGSAARSASTASATGQRARCSW